MIKMEIGSFIELDIFRKEEFYNQYNDLARLNSARFGIYHAIRLLRCKSIYLPYYLCSSVRDFLLKKEINVYYYYISNKFEPIIESIKSDSAILIVNYFGILSQSFFTRIANQFQNLIIDNCQAFFNKPIEGCYNIYSPRKFFGVPDGCYVIGIEATRFTDEYKKDYSSDTSLFLLKRIEFGSSLVYAQRMLNESRIDSSDISQMSTLTQVLLSGINYEAIKAKRIENFIFAQQIFKNINLLDFKHLLDSQAVPMVYPLVIEDKNLVKILSSKNIYTGRWWNHVLKEVANDTFEAWLSNYMVPIPIDQRYGKREIEFVYNEIMKS